MDFDSHLVEPAMTIFKSPRLALPAVLNWIPQAAALLFATAFVAANPYFLEPDFVALLLQQASFSPEFLSPFAPVLVAGVIAGAAWVILGGFAALWFAGIALQAAMAKQGGKATLSEGFSFAKSHLAGFLGAWLAVTVVALACAALVLAVALPVIALLSSNPAAAVVAGTILLFAAIALLIFFSVLFWLLPALVAFESARGFGAFGTFYSLLRARPAAVAVGFLAVAVVSFAIGQLTGMLGQLPIAGYAAAQVILLPITAWSAIVAALVVLKK